MDGCYGQQPDCEDIHLNNKNTLCFIIEISGEFYSIWIQIDALKWCSQ